MALPAINPIIPGFSPDPSVVLVDGTFFLVNSTFHMFPGLPIYVSKDLLSWTQIGNAIFREGQLSLGWSSTRLLPADENDDIMHFTAGLYAPTIRYSNGTFYIVCTNVVHPDDTADYELVNFIVSTRDIWSNDWSNPVYFDFHGIDPSIFIDDDGKSYLQGSAHPMTPGIVTNIHLFEIDLRTGKKLTEEKRIWEGTGGIFAEGPHIYKKDSWYYVIISEGGCYENHMVTVARSMDIWGPYESFSQNPILTARDTKEYIRHIGHSDIFQDQEGTWWGVCLGVRKDGERYILGRETFLFPMEWPEDEWPKMSQVKLNPVPLTRTPLKRLESRAPLTARPLVDYLYIRDANLDQYRFSSDGKSVVLTASKGDFSQWREPVSFVGKRQRSLIGITSLIVHKPSEFTSSLKAGLAYYKDEFRYVKLFYDFSTSEVVLETVATAKKILTTVKHQVRFDATIAFRLEYTERTYKFSYRTDRNTGLWITFEDFDTLIMTAPDFVGPVIGCFAQSEIGGEEVQIESLEVE